MPSLSADELLIGAHTSIAGGVHHALLQGKEIGATTIQLFTSNQKQWKSKDIPPEEINRWNETVLQTGIKNIMSHDSYLINLGSANPEVLQKSLDAFKQEILRCHQLNITYLNFHPGAATVSTEEQCLDQIISSLKKFAHLCQKGTTRLLLEATAGQGSSVGHRFEHLAYILDAVKHEIPIGVCIDTCHIFVAGYDIRTKQGWENTLALFDDLIGLEHLYAFHVNDSAKPFGSKVDRHAELGKGFIGIESFKVLMSHPKTRDTPKYLETPEPMRWNEEIQTLREFSKK